MEQARAPRKWQTNLRLSVDLRERIAQAAALAGISHAAYVELTMRQHFAGLGDPLPPVPPHHPKREPVA